MRIFVTSRSFFFLSFLFFSYFFWLKNRRRRKKKRVTREKRHRNPTGEKRGSIGNCVSQEGQLMVMMTLGKEYTCIHQRRAAQVNRIVRHFR